AGSAGRRGAAGRPTGRQGAVADPRVRARPSSPPPAHHFCAPADPVWLARDVDPWIVAGQRPFSTWIGRGSAWIGVDRRGSGPRVPLPCASSDALLALLDVALPLRAGPVLSDPQEVGHGTPLSVVAVATKLAVEADPASELFRGDVSLGRQPQPVPTPPAPVRAPFADTSGLTSAGQRVEQRLHGSALAAGVLGPRLPGLPHLTAVLALLVVSEGHPDDVVFGEGGDGRRAAPHRLRDRSTGGGLSESALFVEPPQ